MWKYYPTELRLICGHSSQFSNVKDNFKNFRIRVLYLEFSLIEGRAGHFPGLITVNTTYTALLVGQRKQQQQQQHHQHWQQQHQYHLGQHQHGHHKQIQQIISMFQAVDGRCWIQLAILQIILSPQSPVNVAIINKNNGPFVGLK